MYAKKIKLSKEITVTIVEDPKKSEPPLNFPNSM
jgi:hypothetical protein